MIILVGGEKGGSGKSTVSINTAAELAKRGYKVAILDADRKKSSKNWVVTRDSLIESLKNDKDSKYISLETINKLPMKVRNKITSGIATIEGKHATGDIVDTITAMEARNDILIIDVGGGDTEEFHQGLGMADLVICPLKVSILDADTIPNLSRNLKLAKSKNRNLKIISLINEAPTNNGSNDHNELKNILRGTDILSKVSPTILHLRASYRRTLNFGLGVSEWSDAKASGEISVFTEKLINDFNINKKGDL